MEINHLENKRLELLIDRYQSKLLPYAYNILGDLMAAEDLVQEILNHHILSPNSQIQNTDNYLIRSVINRAINQKKLLRNKLEEYPGEWLPSPVLTEDYIYSLADRNQVLNYSLLVLLEQLNPKERAVFLLKETFDFTHLEISNILDIKEDTSRQVLKRAKQKLDSTVHDIHPTTDDNHILHQLTDAILQTDIEKIKNLLSAEVRTISDGGPNVSAARNIIVGPDRVIKLLQAIYGKYYPDNTVTKFVEVNHCPGILYMADGIVFRCIVFEIKNMIIDKIYIIVNPDKLKKINIPS